MPAQPWAASRPWSLADAQAPPPPLQSSRAGLVMTWLTQHSQVVRTFFQVRIDAPERYQLERRAQIVEVSHAQQTQGRAALVVSSWHRGLV
jgi:hypothetical protein